MEYIIELCWDQEPQNRPTASEIAREMNTDKDTISDNLKSKEKILIKILRKRAKEKEKVMLVKQAQLDQHSFFYQLPMDIVKIITHQLDDVIVNDVKERSSFSRKF